MRYTLTREGPSYVLADNRTAEKVATFPSLSVAARMVNPELWSNISIPSAAVCADLAHWRTEVAMQDGDPVAGEPPVSVQQMWELLSGDPWRAFQATQ